MPEVSHGVDTRNDICLAVAARINFGTTVTLPRLAVFSAANVLLVEIPLSASSFATPASGSMTLNASQVGIAVATGVAAQGRFTNRNNVVCLIGDITNPAGTGAIVSLPTTSITSGAPIALSGAPITYSAAV